MKTIFKQSKKLVLACLMIGCIHQHVLAQSTNSTARAYWDKAAQAFNSQRYQDAIEYFSKFLELEPNHLDALENRGRAYLLSDQYNEALDDFNHAIELSPETAKLYLFRGILFQVTGMCKEATINFSKGCELGVEEACQRKCDPTKHLMEQAVTEYKNKNYQKAIAILTQVLNHDPQHELAWYYRAHAFLYSHRYQEALRDITKTINLKPNDRDNWRARGQIYEKLKQYDKALFDYSTALKSALSYAELTGDHDETISILTDRALVYQRLGKCDKANTDFKLACIYRASGGSPCNQAWCGESIANQKNHEALITKTSALLRKQKPIIQKMEADLNKQFRATGFKQAKLDQFMQYKAHHYQVYIYRYAGLINDYGNRYPNDVFRVVQKTKW